MGFVVTEEMAREFGKAMIAAYKRQGTNLQEDRQMVMQEFIDRHNLAPASAVEEVELTHSEWLRLWTTVGRADEGKLAQAGKSYLASLGLRIVRDAKPAASFIRRAQPLNLPDDDGFCSVGGLAVDLGLYKSSDAKPVPAFDFLAHLRRQREWSERTFGPAKRTSGVVEHIRKELREIEAAPDDLEEWIDVVILALDGAWRHGGSPEQIIDKLAEKQAKNESRTWPDWRTMPEGKAIEHDRSGESKPVPADNAAKRDAKDATIAELTKRIDALELGYRDAKATNAEIQDDVDRLDAATGELLEWCKRLSREKAPAESRNPEPKAVAAERTFTEAEVRAAMRLLKSDVAIRHIFDKLGIDMEATK